MAPGLAVQGMRTESRDRAVGEAVPDVVATRSDVARSRRSMHALFALVKINLACICLCRRVGYIMTDLFTLLCKNIGKLLAVR